jgi:meso-butanediol dehydrogenase/(S,S)-butanediol dehydrogenase/diacetyl reductase
MRQRGGVVVTGASGDIGREAVTMLLAAGHPVIGVDTAARAAAPAATRGRHDHVVADITRATDLTALAALLDRRGDMRHAVLVAGGAVPDEIGVDPLRVPDDVFARSVELNLSAQYRLVRHLTPVLAVGGGDRSITFVSSINSGGNFGAPAYAAAKAGLSGLVAALSVPLGAHGIRLNAVALGTVTTRRAAQLHADDPGRTGRMAALAASGRVLSPAEAAETIVVVATRTRAVTGTVITADGGQSIPGPRPPP